MASTNDPNPTTPKPETDALADAERRAALAKLGALGAWTAPALLTLLVSPRASAESLGGPPSY